MNALEKIEARMEKVEKGWSLSDSRRARSLVQERYADLPCTVESVQIILDALIEEFGNDHGEIERVILQHFKK